jgi:hypothetical protein
MTARRFLHQLYLGYPDSAAARGISPPQPDASHTPQRRRPKRPVRAVTRMAVPKPVKRLVRLVPGVHW